MKPCADCGGIGIVATRIFKSEVSCIITPAQGKPVLWDRSYTTNFALHEDKISCVHCGYVSDPNDYIKEMDGVMPTTKRVMSPTKRM